LVEYKNKLLTGANKAQAIVIALQQLDTAFHHFAEAQFDEHSALYVKAKHEKSRKSTGNQNWLRNM